MSLPVIACVGIGGNVGDVMRSMADAIRAIDALPSTRLAAVSPAYRTPAWGVEDQPDFINAAIRIETALPADRLMQALLGIERGLGRTRLADGSDRWGPRRLDLDLLLYADHRIDEPGLTVPHPRLHLRAFALAPLLDVWPDAQIPGVGAAQVALDAIEGRSLQALEEPIL